MKTRQVKSLSILVLLSALSAGTAVADGVARGKFVSGDDGRYANGQRLFSRDNGVSGSSRYRAYSSDSADRWSRNKTLTDGQGNAYRRSTDAFRGPNGSSGYKVTEQLQHTDGSATQYKRRQINGAEGGSYKADTTLQRSVDGQLSGERSVMAQGASGKTYMSESQMIDGHWTRSASCADASGNPVECR